MFAENGNDDFLSSRVNPITGYMDTSEKVSPFAGMTEEQKEYEAIKLVSNKNLYSNEPSLIVLM